MRAIGAIIALVAACRFRPATDPRRGDAGADWLDGFSYRRRLAIASGASSTLDDFVVAVVLADDRGLADHARDDGRDLAITDLDSNVLDFEIEDFDGASGQLAAWVRIPHLAGTDGAYLYYGGDATDLQDPAGTWVRGTFDGVWHLTDPSPDQARDSTSGAHALASPTATRAPATARAGVVGEARDYDGVDDTLRAADDDGFDHGSGSFSYGVWVLVTQSAGSYDMPLFKGGSSANTPGYDLELGTGDWNANVGDGTANVVVSFGSESSLLGAWNQLVVVVDRSTQLLRVFTNGAPSGAADIASLGSTDSSLGLDVGTNNGSSYPFRGQLDEPRIYARALSPDWIAAEYANLSSPTSFVTVGDEELAP